MHPGIAFCLAVVQSCGNVGSNLHSKLEHVLAKSLKSKEQLLVRK